MFFIKPKDKSRLLAVQLQQCSGPVLVFTRTKWMARKLTTKVNRMGFATTEIHSNRSQGQRQAALEGFKRGKYQILVATDIAARGIDVSGIELVVNYDMPANSEDYVHRVGRTGRAGKTGHAVSFATVDQRGSIRDIERFMKTDVAVSALPKLPSEKLLFREAKQLDLPSEPTRDAKPSRRKSAQRRSTKNRDFHSGSSRKIARKLARKRVGRKQADDNRGDESIRSQSKPKPTKTQGSQSTESNQKKSKSESPFWTNFKKHRPARKKSAAKGSGRKRRSKH